MKLLLFSFALMLSASVNAISFTPPQIDGWQQDGEVEVFDQSNLFNHINGASEFYFSYNFQKVWVVRYKNGDAELTIEVYDHGDSNHAFGIYSMERPPEADVRKIGAQGYYEDAILNFVVDRYYVKMNSYREPGAGSSVLLKTANKLVPDLSEGTALPHVIELFPQENRVPNSRQFIPDTFMGLEFMGSAFRAGYENEEGEVTMFVMERENNDQIKEILRNYLNFAQMDVPGLVEGEYVIEDPFNGNVYLYWEGNRLIGFSGDNVPSLRNFLIDLVLK